MRRSVMLIAILVLAGAGYRVVRVAVGSVKTGETKASPDGRFEASVMDSFSETFFGQEKHWLEFAITGSGQNQFLKTDYIEGPYFGSRSSYSVIEWAKDSSAVTFLFPSVSLSMKLEAKP
jgi:hypothetical protein